MGFFLETLKLRVVNQVLNNQFSPEHYVTYSAKSGIKDDETTSADIKCKKIFEGYCKEILFSQWRDIVPNLKQASNSNQIDFCSISEACEIEVLNGKNCVYKRDPSKPEKEEQQKILLENVGVLIKIFTGKIQSLFESVKSSPLEMFELSQPNLQKIQDRFCSFEEIDLISIWPRIVSVLPAEARIIGEEQITVEEMGAWSLDLIRNWLRNEANLPHITGVMNLDLNKLNLHTLPRELGFFNPTTLSLGQNKISILPPFIGNFNRLVTLNLGTNKILQLPEELKNLTMLRTLYLGRNQISVLPEDVLKKLTQLHILHLGTNNISAMPIPTTPLSALKYLCLDENNISVLPKAFIEQLAEGITLNLGRNPILELPASIWDHVEALEFNRENETLLHNLVVPEKFHTQLPDQESQEIIIRKDNDNDLLPMYQ